MAQGQQEELGQQVVQVVQVELGLLAVLVPLVVRDQLVLLDQLVELAQQEQQGALGQLVELAVQVELDQLAVQVCIFSFKIVNLMQILTDSDTI